MSAPCLVTRLEYQTLPGRTSYPSHIRRPDEFMHLQLKSYVQPVGKDPFRQKAKVQFAEHGAEKNRASRTQRSYCRTILHAQSIVRAVLDDKLDLVFPSQVLQVDHNIRSVIPLPGHFTSRMTWATSSTGVISIAPLVSMRIFKSLRAEVCHQRQRVRLVQRLASRHLHQPTVVCPHLGDHLFNRHLGAAMESIFRITPRAPERATRQPDKHTGPPLRRVDSPCMLWKSSVIRSIGELVIVLLIHRFKLHYRH